MFILINKQVFNVLNLEIGDIKKFDKEELVRIYKEGPKSYNSSLLMTEIYMKASTDKWFENNTSHWKETDDDYGSYEIIDFEGVKDGFYFIIKDDKKLLVSRLYATEKEAEAARDKLLTTANHIVARLFKVEI